MSARNRPYHSQAPFRCSRGARSQACRLGARTPQYACVLVERGAVAIRYDSGDGNWHHCPAGSLFQRFPEQGHEVDFSPNTIWWSLGIPASCLDSLQDMNWHLPEQPVLPCPQFDTCLHRWRKLADQYRHGNRATAYRLLPDALSLLQQLMPMPSTVENPSDPYQRVHQLLQQELDLVVNLKELASQCDIAYDTLRLGFKKRFGLSPGAFRIQCRIDRACDLLQDGMGVAETAEQLGYCDAFAFSKQFKQLLGSSPSHWQAKQ